MVYRKELHQENYATFIPQGTFNKFAKQLVA